MRLWIFALVIGCGAGITEDDVELAGADVEPLEITITDDCKDGGTYQMNGVVDVVEDPPGIVVNVEYTYTACADKHGTVSGTVAYGATQGQAAELITTAIEYSSDLTYSGEHAGSCVASVAYADNSSKPEKVAVGCPHPHAKQVAKVASKCRLGKGKKKKPKKKDCELR